MSEANLVHLRNKQGSLRSPWTPKFLKQCFTEAGLYGIRDMDRSEVRGKDHGWINMGVVGTK